MMAVLRIHKKQQNFIILDKTCLNDEKLSWAAKGLHAYLMSLPDDWRVQVVDLQRRSKNGRDAVRALLNELEQAGYIIKSTSRDNESGRFGGIEYLVLEIPEPKNEEKAPDPEKPSSVNPAPEKPATGNPSPEKATLISNKYNNYPRINNKTAAERNNALITDSSPQQKAAAVISYENYLTKKQVTNGYDTTVNTSQPEDSIISDALTPNQTKRVAVVVQKLNASSPEMLEKEIVFCILSKKHFTACGKDFGRKLNAIRTVILRGDWQTPAEMVVENKGKKISLIQKLEVELRASYAECTHFQKLLSNAKEHTKEYFEDIIKKVQIKIKQLECQIKESSNQMEAEVCL